MYYFSSLNIKIFNLDAISILENINIDSIRDVINKWLIKSIFQIDKIRINNMIYLYLDFRKCNKNLINYQFKNIYRSSFKICLINNYLSVLTYKKKFINFAFGSYEKKLNLIKKALFNSLYVMILTFI